MRMLYYIILSWDKKGLSSIMSAIRLRDNTAHEVVIWVDPPIEVLIKHEASKK